MNHVERFRAVMNFKPVDRLPVWEWAMWWDQTIARWKTEGLPAHLQGVFEIGEYLGLDPYQQFWFSTTESTLDAVQHHVEGMVGNMDDYRALRPRLFPEHDEALQAMVPWAKRQGQGEAVVWITFEGFFWFPRTLMNIERQMLAFYDDPELIHQINEDLCAYHLRMLEKIAKVCVPTFMTFAEDMSYNHGPMLSKEAYETFLAPYYARLMPRIQELGIIPLVDTDGNPTKMIPWLQASGMAGVLPMERQAGVDGMALREAFPKLAMVGHYNKLVMNLGEEAIAAEFERLVPLQKTGGYIPSVDHQTPPAVSLDEYRGYLRLLKEYARKV